MPDEIRFEVDQFNRKVITPEFNQVVAEELAKHIDPALPDKTLIFAATDAHADIVVSAVKTAFAERYGEIDDAAVKKIAGSVDKVQGLIRSFRDDANPKIAVTVDLLTTGIDVPKITNLVFLRRVNSRILDEQMIGHGGYLKASDAERLDRELQQQVRDLYEATSSLLRSVQLVRPGIAEGTDTGLRYKVDLLSGSEPTFEARQVELDRQGEIWRTGVLGNQWPHDVPGTSVLPAWSTPAAARNHHLCPQQSGARRISIDFLPGSAGAGVRRIRLRVARTCYARSRVWLIPSAGVARLGAGPRSQR